MLHSLTRFPFYVLGLAALLLFFLMSSSALASSTYRYSLENKSKIVITVTGKFDCTYSYGRVVRPGTYLFPAGKSIIVSHKGGVYCGGDDRTHHFDFGSMKGCQFASVQIPSGSTVVFSGSGKKKDYKLTLDGKAVDLSDCSS